MSIPKIIHYCWFGGKPLPKSCEKLLDTWKKHLPDYEIRRWDETTFDVTSSEFVRAAYASGKYAFVSDYVRLYALKEYGGVYLDTDIEVLRSFDALVQPYSAVFGFESEDWVMSAFMAAQPEHPIICDFFTRYAEMVFDAADPVPNTVILTGLLQERGLQTNNTTQLLDGNTAVFPLDHFQTYNMKNARLCVTEHSYTIHKCFGSWCPPMDRLSFAFKRILGRILSEKTYSKLKAIKKRIMGEQI